MKNVFNGIDQGNVCIELLSQEEQQIDQQIIDDLEEVEEYPSALVVYKGTVFLQLHSLK